MKMERRRIMANKQIIALMAVAILMTPTMAFSATKTQQALCSILAERVLLNRNALVANYGHIRASVNRLRQHRSGVRERILRRERIAGRRITINLMSAMQLSKSMGCRS